VGNLALNRGVNVRPVQVAAGARHGRVPFYRAPWNDAESSTIARTAAFEPDGDIPASPLADLLTDAEIARTRIIKVDVEGGEWDVVAGLVGDIERFPAELDILIEVHPDPDGSRSAAGLADMLASHGFAASWLAVDFRAVAHLDRRPRAEPVAGVPPPGELAHLVLSRRAAPAR
jgi:FkbM family methyltransferase